MSVGALLLRGKGGPHLYDVPELGASGCVEAVLRGQCLDEGTKASQLGLLGPKLYSKGVGEALFGNCSGRVARILNGHFDHLGAMSA